MKRAIWTPTFAWLAAVGVALLFAFAGPNEASLMGRLPAISAKRLDQQPIVLRAVASEDAMTAHAVNIPFDCLEHVATRIVNEVQGVNRVFYDLTSKPPATIELE